MSRLAKEKEDLSRADRDIADGERRIYRQITLIDRLKAQGHSTTHAEALLEGFRVMLDAWRRHRDEIVKTIARLEAGAREDGHTPLPLLTAVRRPGCEESAPGGDSSD